MTRRSRGVTVVIQRDGTTRSQTIRLSLWTVRLVLLGGVCLLAGLGLLAVLYLPIVRAAARVPGLERQVARLTRTTPKCGSSRSSSTASRCGTPSCAR